MTLSLQFNSVLKIRSATERTPVSTIHLQEEDKFKEAVGGDLVTTALHFPQLPTVKTRMYSAKRQHYPLLPKTLNEVIVEGEWTQDKNHKRFLLKHIQEGNKNILIFCSDKALQLLASCTRWHADGTFYVVPDYFYQLFIIHVWYKSNMLPVSYVLMNNREEDSYKRVISELKEAALELRLVLTVH